MELPHFYKLSLELIINNRVIFYRYPLVICFIGLKGTAFYFSPEVKAIQKEALKTGNKNPKGDYNSLDTDIYALGLISLELLIG